MSKSLVSRFSSLPVCSSCRTSFVRPQAAFLRPLVLQRPATNDAKPTRPNTRLGAIGASLSKPAGLQGKPNAVDFILGDALNSMVTTAQESEVPTTYFFHIYATKHNTHITLATPDRSPKISVSAGNLGFRKANRGTYDAAYQLASYVLGRIQEEGLLNEIREIEVVLRGFGIGREAVTKAILGTEGRLVRNKIIRVTDATRLKFGGTRSPKPRRLG